jgi:hypothetical protein
MLMPDELFAKDVVDALDLRCLPDVPRCVNQVGRDERWWLEQRCGMLDAVLGWLERWECSPATDPLQAEGDPLWQSVTVLHRHLASSRNWLCQRIEEIDEVAERVCGDS